MKPIAPSGHRVASHGRGRACQRAARVKRRYSLPGEASARTAPPHTPAQDDQQARDALDGANTLHRHDAGAFELQMRRSSKTVAIAMRDQR
jgi:hypothetical protein